MKRREFIQTTALGTIAAGTLGYGFTYPNIPDKEAKYCYESEREIPILEDVDVLVVGGSSGAVAAASAAAKKGCSVFLIGYLPYLGDDICGTYRYWMKDGETPNSGLAKKIFGEKMPTPMHVKSTLDKELIDNGVKFLYSCYATNLIFDGNNRVSGAVVVSRSGRQAIKAKVVIDATQGAEIAKMAGAKIKHYSLRGMSFFFTVVGNNIRNSNNILDVKKRPEEITTEDQSINLYQIEYGYEGNNPKNDLLLLRYDHLEEQMHFKGQDYDVLEYQFQYDLKDNSYASLMEVEHKIRKKTFDIEQTDCSDLIHYLPPYKIVCKKRFEKDIDNVEDIPIEAFIPEKVENLLLLNPCADVNREAAEKINSSVSLMKLGETIGTFSANLAVSVSISDMVSGKSQMSKNYLENGEIKEYLRPLRPIQDRGYVKNSAATLPVLGEYDVVVSGGGTAGAPAGLGASMHGAKTLVLEYLHGLGGIGTMGHVEIYWDGNKEGFTKIIDKGVREMAPADHPRHIIDNSGWVFDWKTEWLRRETIKAGGDVWFGAMGCGTWVEDNKIKGIVVSTPFGRGVVLCKVIIDGSGSSDIAIASGNKYSFINAENVAVQGTGLAYRFPGQVRNNSDWTFADESDVLDVSRLYVQGKEKFKGKYDICKIPQTRERRRQEGEYMVSTYDVMNRRRYEDTISYHIASFDTHGYTVDPIFLLKPETARGKYYRADMPLRSLLPKGINGLITTGLGASVDRDAMPVMRMQACLQNQGYAVGYLAATAVMENKDVREVDIKKIQKHLVDIGSLPERVVTDTNTKEFSDAQLQEAADAVVNSYEKLEVLLTNPEKTIEIISKRFVNAGNDDDKLIYASILAVLNNDIGWNVIQEEIKKYKEWDEGWHFTGHGYEKRLSNLDSLIFRLGLTKNKAGISPVIEKADELKTEDYFSHFRAIAVAFENIKPEEATEVLTKMLEMDNMQGYDMDDYKDALTKLDFEVKTSGFRNDTVVRNKELKEIILARALYRCGDKNGLGKKILTNYANGLNGIYARHAWEILNETST